MNNLVRATPLLALAAATLWGGGDFSGGMGVQSAGGGLRATLRVVLFSHITSFAVLVAIARLRGDAFPHGALLAWGLTAGVAGGAAITCFYLALSRGAMGASAALSGLLAAAIPAALTLGQQGSPGVRPLAGFAVAALAIWLIAAGPAHSTAPASRGTMLLAMLAGIGFGIYFVALKMAGPAGIIWPMATARIGSLTVCSLMYLTLAVRKQGGETGTSLKGTASAVPKEPHKPSGALAPEVRFPPGSRFTRRAIAWALGAALLDTGGNLLFIAATRAGRLDVAAILGSLYPAATILLAAFTLGEHPTRRQTMGMVTGVVAVALIAL